MGARGFAHAAMLLLALVAGPGGCGGRPPDAPAAPAPIARAGPSVPARASLRTAPPAVAADHGAAERSGEAVPPEDREEPREPEEYPAGEPDDAEPYDVD